MKRRTLVGTKKRLVSAMNSTQQIRHQHLTCQEYMAVSAKMIGVAAVDISAGDACYIDYNTGRISVASTENTCQED